MVEFDLRRSTGVGRSWLGGAREAMRLQRDALRLGEGRAFNSYERFIFECD